jgi:YidC/Oxa1 family membrane protein insertase
LDRNTLLAVALSMLVLTGWSYWNASHMPPPAPAEEAVVPSADPGSDWPGGESALAAGQKSATRIRESAPLAVAADALATSAPETVELASDLFGVELDNQGGGISSWRLLDPKYTVSSGSDETPIELITWDDGGTVVLTTGLEGLGIGNLKDALFSIETNDPERVVFVYERDGITVRKSFKFEPDSYLFDFEIEIVNGTDRILETDVDVDWPAAMVDGNDFTEQSLIALVNDDVETERLPSVGSGGFFAFLGYGDEGPSTYTGLVEWSGVSNRYFLAALIPDAGSVGRVSFEPLVVGKRALSRFVYEDVEIKPGESESRSYRGFIGPKIANDLAEIKPGLERSIDFGYSWLEPLTRFFHWLLSTLFGFVGNYGVAIILVTLLVRLATLPIMQKQMKSMERMRELQPKLKVIQDKFKEDRQKQSEEQMKLYKEEGVNPLGGCLPMLLQFPVFIGLFYALQSTIALRHAPFALWITDLSAPEQLFLIPILEVPVRVLPIVMGASMFIQQRMTPMTGMDPVQAKMMTTVMPLMMTVLFYQFPSGLVLYWMISNFLGIGHQLYVRKSREAAAAAA